ncbi:MAG TPA: phage portal protein [Candidatus Lokiarchaeia archaeon]
MFELITVPVKLKIAEWENKKALYEKSTKVLTEYAYVEDEWKNINAQGLDKKELDEDNYEILRNQAIMFYYRNAHARAVISNFVNFVIGKGVIIKPLDEDKKIIEYWKSFQKNNKFRRRSREIVERCFRDGEVFIRFFGLGTDECKMRFIDSDTVDDPQKKFTYGIETDTDDVENPIAYIIKQKDSNVRAAVIPADEIIHDKILVDSNVKRGRSLIEVVMPEIKKYAKWLDSRILLSEIRTSIALVKKIKGSSSDVGTIVNANKSRLNTTDTNRTKKIKAGSIITANEGVEYEFLSPKLEARDAKEDGRNILLSIAAAMQMPEYMLTGDSSNANYASTIVSESPFVKAAESWQEFFSEVFTQIYIKVMKSAMDSGNIPDKYKIEKKDFDKLGNEIKIGEEIKQFSLECSVEFPEIINRDFKERIEGLLMLKGEGILSDDTLSDKVDLDLDVEDNRTRMRELKRRKTFGEFGDRDRQMAMKTEEPPNGEDEENGE